LNVPTTLITVHCITLRVDLSVQHYGAASLDQSL
jgi:hypothetical protein